MTLTEYPRPALRQSPETVALLEGLQTALEGLWTDIEAAGRQLDLDRADWGLEVWEAAMGIPVEADKSVEFRRNRVKAKLRGQGTTTVEAIHNIAASFSNGVVEVREIPGDYRVEIEFVGQVGLPPNLNDLKSAIAEVLPAHLEPWYISQLKTWGDVAAQTWDDVAGETWESLRGGSI